MNNQEIVTTHKPSVDQILESLDISKETLKDYRYRIDFFTQFTNENGLTYATFVEFKRFLADRENLSTPSKNKYLTVARVFLKELNRRGILPTDITQNVKSFKQSRGHVVFGVEMPEIESIISEIHKLPTTPQNSRLKAIFALLVHQGLRQCEAVRLDLADLNLNSGIAFILGKGRDQKEPIYLSPDTVKILRQYISKCKIVDGALFKSMGNRHSTRLTTKTVNREMKKLFELAGIDRTVHGLRHFYITNLLNNMDMRDVRKFSRHRSIETLTVYDDELDISQKAKQVFEYLPKI